VPRIKDIYVCVIQHHSTVTDCNIFCECHPARDLANKNWFAVSTVALKK
jgi:hypothetical protein